MAARSPERTRSRWPVVTRTEGVGPESASAENYPQQTLDWTIAFGPGGGNDIMSRTLIEILQKYDLYTENIVATNMEGGERGQGLGISSTTRKETPTTSPPRAAAS